MWQVAAAALQRAHELGCSHAWFREDQVRTAGLLLRDANVVSTQDATDTGFSVRVVHDGAWGFAAGVDVTISSAVAVVEQAVAIAKAVAVGGRHGEPAEEPGYGDVSWVGPCAVDPFGVPEDERVALLADWSGRLLGAPRVAHVMAKLVLVRENKFYADLAGTTATQERVRIHPQVLAFGDGATLRSCGPPTARGWEYVTGTGWDWDSELAEMPSQLAAKTSATPVEPGRYDLVIEPSNLWLTVHETIGHATELDRALGYETSYAGTTFVSPEHVGALRYGSAHLSVTADRTAEHSLATIGYDDEGVAAQSWPLIDQGVLVGLQFDRHTARLFGAERSNGCSYAESGLHVPISRMPNVSVQPSPGGPDTAELIAAVEDGIHIAGADSWSIDASRQNFQFTAQRCHRIRHGQLAEPLRDVAYTGVTTAFWGSLDGTGGPGTYQVFGADLCGKGQPVQAAAVSHGSPSVLVRQIQVINTGGGS
ncbi:TldD/PmbA family protein [Actinosynnema sp. ALI-1.44]|uniref:TldD/PmbA family protein n=1 Tax=Actinosynnema sp. ALI-1.44 TaxID=1933779 RepID=UPI0011781FCA|nr:TldD/PmbA family protein [Actinosynnema sp. ALI-1.44]